MQTTQSRLLTAPGGFPEVTDSKSVTSKTPLSSPDATDSESVASRKSLRAWLSSFVAATAGDSLGFYAELETTWERVVLSCPCTFTAMPSLTIRLAPDLLTALEATATAQGTTRTALVTAALAQYLQLPPEPLEARLEAIESRLEALESSRKTTAPPQHQSRRTIAPVTQDTMGGDSNTPAGLSQLEALIESGAIPPGTPRGSANGMIRRRFQQSPEDFLEALGWTLHGNGNRRRWRPPEDTTPTG